MLPIKKESIDIRIKTEEEKIDFEKETKLMSTKQHQGLNKYKDVQNVVINKSAPKLTDISTRTIALDTEHDFFMEDPA